MTASNATAGHTTAGQATAGQAKAGHSVLARTATRELTITRPGPGPVLVQIT